MNFSDTNGKVRLFYTYEIATSGTKVHIFTTKVHLHHPKVEGRDGPGGYCYTKKMAKPAERSATAAREKF